MKKTASTVLAPALGLGALLLSATVDAPIHAQPSTPNGFLEYCLDNSSQCAVSINHLTQGWERHFNADRLQVTASTFKILTLIAYADAVVDGRLDPDRVIDRDQWARYSVRRDGGALQNAYNRLGNPQSVTLDQMVSAMMRESDNAAPDWILNELGRESLQRVVDRYVNGYHDVPRSINALFVAMDGNPEDPDIGSRTLIDYSAFSAPGFQNESASWFRRLGEEGFADQVRDFTCLSLPWRSPPPGCVPGWRTRFEEYRNLLGDFFMKSNTRTYNRLMTGIFQGDLLPPEVGAIVTRHLEFRVLEFPNFAAVFTRHGAKGGSLAPQDVLNWTVYMESRGNGHRVVVSIFMHDVPFGVTPQLNPFGFAEALVFDPDFALRVRDAIAPETPRPELLATIPELRVQASPPGESLRISVEVRNIGVAPAAGFDVSVYASQDNRLSAEDSLLDTVHIPAFQLRKGRRSLEFFVRLNRKGAFYPLSGKYVFVVVDDGDRIEEGDEGNNVVWERIVPRPDLPALRNSPAPRQ